MPANAAEETTEQETKHEHSPRKRIRHRKKQLYDNILKQMEFYFSEANLSKDRFLGDLVKNDPWVPLDQFLKFNKIRTLTQDLTDIAKAMKHSTLLELSEDRSKVKRKVPVQKYNADERTVYVESIPVSATREWLQRVFSEYGPIAYISLPTFKNSKTIKGFAFIEFAKPEDVQKCLRVCSEMGCKLPTCMAPDELSSIKMFSVDNTPEFEKESLKEPYQKEPVKEEYEPPKKKKKSKEKKGKGLELKLGQDSDSEKKMDTPSDENKSINSTTPTEEKSLLLDSKDEMTSHDEGAADPNTPRKKKTRKRNKEKNKGLDKVEAPKDSEHMRRISLSSDFNGIRQISSEAENTRVVTDKSIRARPEKYYQHTDFYAKQHCWHRINNSTSALWGMQVLPKPEWKALRNKYLNLQRQYMKEMKQNWRERRQDYNIPQPAAPALDTALPSSEAEEKTVPKLEKIPDVFVKEILPEPTFDVRLTKRTIRSNIHALHVDVKEGQAEVIIRFDSASAAKDYCSNSSNRSRLLTSSEQEEQWARAEAARGSHRPRGRCKLAARVAIATPAPSDPEPTHTHIRFDE